ncbi:hypothetical protein [Dysgonomonas sp. 511]|uniref:hypothetical protein n=1 Tax=Dysgonomonas sp. 511 TaxID=2302930 RepID=UPI0013D03341|nr:hypothetical protein [Dysgonomonas sp. 511]NDV77470.1 hypothetical protein [Dysgonomonas sp. 511]
MKPSDFEKLEKDTFFKKTYLNKTPWWKTLAMLPPVLLLFVGLVGLLYLLKSDMLISVYMIPYLLLFMLGTIWLKAVKRNIQKTKMSADGSFLVCIGKPLGEKAGYTYVAFAKDNRRHSPHYLNTPLKSVSLDEVLAKYPLDELKKDTKRIEIEDSNAEIFVKAISGKDINKSNPQWEQNEGYLPLLYIDDRYSFVIKPKDIRLVAK